MGKLDGKVAIVSGGSSGIGEATVKLFVAEGAKVVFTGRNVERGERVQAEVGEAARFVKAENSVKADWESVLAVARETFGEVNILVNNAGIGGAAKPIDELTEEEYREVLDANLVGPFLGMNTVIPSIKAAGEGGAIVNVSSTGGMAASPTFTGYCSAKFGLRGMTKVAALDLAPFNIRVNSVHPGAVRTAILDESFGDYICEHTPLARIANADEIAKLILFLSCDDSAYSTGAEFIADGGVLASLY